MKSQKELLEELNAKRKEISELKEVLNKLNEEKEDWFRKKEELFSKIKTGIIHIKEFKAKRDALTSEIKELKPKRDSLNLGVSTKLKDFQSIKDEKEKLSRNLKLRKSPHSIKEEIERLEFKIETEPMPFDKEREIVKKIKQLKNALGEAAKVMEADSKIHEAQSTVRTERKEANDIHRQIQEKAQQGQKMHEEILKISAEVDKLKAEEKEAFMKFSELKRKFTEANNKFKEKLKETDPIRDQLNQISSDKKEKRKQDIKTILKSKEDIVNEKIRKGGKLTTEDLLVFQNMRDSENNSNI